MTRKKGKLTPEEIFLNKDLSDRIRDLVLNAPLTFDKALGVLKISKDYKRGN